MHAEPFREARTDPTYTASDVLIRKVPGGIRGPGWIEPLAESV